MGSGGADETRPPTAGEVLDHLHAGGLVMTWHIGLQEWRVPKPDFLRWLGQGDWFRAGGGNVPQPGLRLVPGAAEGDGPTGEAKP